MKASRGSGRVRGGVGIVLGVVSLLGGCGEREPKPEGVRDAVRAQGRAEGARAEADLQAIRTALQEYQVEHGRFPETLEALPFIRDRRTDTSGYAYDAGTGEVRLREGGR